MKKTIGIPAYCTETSIGAGKTHLHYMSKFGTPVVIMPGEEFRKVDLLYLPGGADLNPLSYGDVPGFYTGNPDVLKQFFFEKRLQTYIDERVPIFGVCLGFQMLNVKFGGKLEQHLLYHPQSPARREKGHQVRLTRDEKVKFEVNSHHHQGVLESQVSKDFDVLAVEDEAAKYDRVVEAFRHKELPIAGVQWHPEEWFDNFSESLVKTIMSE